MKRLGQITIFDRPVYSVHISDFEGLLTIELPSEYSVLLLVSDATGIDSEIIYSSATRLIESGLIYVCTWGSDCERVHDLFDEAEVRDGSADKDDVVMTTWHADDSLDDAIYFFLTCAFPLDHELDTCSWLAVTVGDRALADSVARKIAEAIPKLAKTSAEPGTGAKVPPAGQRT